MKSVVEILEAQHRALEREVGTLEGALSGGRTDELKAALGRLKAMLIAHFELEQSQFYPALLERTLGQAQLHQTVTLFHANLGRIAEGVLGFFEKWAALRPEQLTAFQTEWRSTLQLLSRRLRDEEKALHPLHRRVFGA